MNESKNAPETAVIGAGIIGVCCAIKLQNQGIKVTLIDKVGVAQGCSKGNAGHFATEQVFPLAELGLLKHIPKMLFSPNGPIKIRLAYLPFAMPWFIRFFVNMLPARFKRHSKALKTLNIKAIEAYDELLEQAGLSHLLIKQGSLMTFENTDLKIIEQIKNKYLDNGIRVELLSRSQVKNLEPSLSSNVTYALYFPDVGHTQDPEKLCLSLFEYFMAQGGQFVQEHVHSIEQSKEKVRISTSLQTIHCDTAILAAGAWSKRLLTPLKYKVPLDTERGYHYMVKNHPNINRPIASYERKFIMTPMTSGLRLAGTVEFAGLNTKSNKKRATALASHSTKLLDGINITESLDGQHWMGMRPSLPDSLPVIGRAPKHDRLFFAFGHQHLGLTQAAITGKLIAELVCKKPSSIELEPFSINRFD
ncbi:FAD-binding oxidoreductase [Aliiglaciecola sp. M165]|uniref:NAD(P)/FAD-dependent oxidoreductase n=1 Tax=Aliiglaciecola sp. M165 TaxID=2593649 RepID=UPI001180B630|nr:FAD-dependent oxidoreductase [Aliiglaciecola sp. M165]TRY29821.1 FAD-binding oxidoreductase [Aliiglaciecola sp. M165]